MRAPTNMPFGLGPQRSQPTASSRGASAFNVRAIRLSSGPRQQSIARDRAMDPRSSNSTATSRGPRTPVTLSGADHMASGGKSRALRRRAARSRSQRTVRPVRAAPIACDCGVRRCRRRARSCGWSPVPTQSGSQRQHRGPRCCHRIYARIRWSLPVLPRWVPRGSPLRGPHIGAVRSSRRMTDTRRQCFCTASSAHDE